MQWYVLTEDFTLEHIGYNDLYQGAYQHVLDQGIPFIEVVSDYQVEQWIEEYNQSMDEARGVGYGTEV